MKHLILAAAAATLTMAVVPAFAASPADDAENGYSTYSPVSPCHFVNEPVRMQNGRVVYRQVQVCS